MGRAQAARERRIELFTGTPLLAELTDILSRRKLEKKISASTFTVDQLVDRYAALAALVRPASTPRIAPDPDDGWTSSGSAIIELTTPEQDQTFGRPVRSARCRVVQSV